MKINTLTHSCPERTRQGQDLSHKHLPSVIRHIISFNLLNNPMWYILTVRGPNESCLPLTMPLCHITWLLLPSRGRLHFPSPWLWAGLVTDFGRYERTDAVRLPRLAVRDLAAFTLTLPEHSCGPVRKPQLRYRMRDHVKRERPSQQPKVHLSPFYPTNPSWAASWLHLHEWAQTKPAKEPSRPKESWEIIAVLYYEVFGWLHNNK